MKTFTFAFVGFMIYSSCIFSDVRLKNDLVIIDSFIGARFLGEIINESETPIKNVKITITSKDIKNNIIDVSEAYIEGYTNPEDGFSNDYIPIGSVAPFITYADVKADSIYTTSYTINYEKTNVVFENPDQVKILGDINIVSNSYGVKFFGEIINNSASNIYWVKILFAFKDIKGKLIDIDYSFINGDDYISPDGFYNSDCIYKGSYAPFVLTTYLNKEEIEDFYTIITYWIGDQKEYHYEGKENVFLNSEINKVNSYGYGKYLGDIKNTTNREIYFVKITLISRDNYGKIIDISYDYVLGTNYTYYNDFTTDSHIAPGSTVPFEVSTYVNYDDIASYEYKINYEYSKIVTLLEENKLFNFDVPRNYPNPFNPKTSIIFTIRENTDIELSVYNSVGQKIYILFRGYIQAGKHCIVWDATGFPSGVYLYSLKTNNEIKTNKMMLIK